MVLATRHTGIVVEDLERSLVFWRDVMGLEVVADFREEGEFIDTVQGLSGVRLHMVKLRDPMCRSRKLGGQSTATNAWGLSQ